MTVKPLKSAIPLHTIGFFACFVCLLICYSTNTPKRKATSPLQIGIEEYNYGYSENHMKHMNSLCG
jgi:hypothetical protein